MKQFLVGIATLSVLVSAFAQNEAKKTDYGPFFSATIRAPGGNTTMKGVVATVGADKNAYVCFDTDLLRASVGWTGDWLKTGNYLREIVHPQPPEIAGTPMFSTKPGPGWIRGNNAGEIAVGAGHSVTENGNRRAHEELRLACCRPRWQDEPMTAIKAHFDGKVLVPDEPVQLPVNQPLTLIVQTVRPATLLELAKVLESMPDAPDTPTDLAAQHDHYLHGMPKRP